MGFCEMNYYLKGNLLYLALFIPVTLLIQQIFPSINTGSFIFKELYQTIDTSTFHLDLNKVFLYVVSLVIGFTFVNIVNLKRKWNPFRNPNGYEDIFKLIGIGFILAMATPLINFVGKYDYEGFCKPEQYGLMLEKSERQSAFVSRNITNAREEWAALVEHTTFELGLAANKTFSKLGSEIDSILTHLKFENKQECYFPSFWEIFLRNYIFFVIPYVFGLNFTHMDDIEFFKTFTLTWSEMKDWDFLHWLVFIVLIGFIGVNLILLYAYYAACSKYRFFFYIILISSIVLYFAIKSYIVRGKQHFHLHHYALMMIIIPNIGVQGIYWSMIIGIVSGIMVEGSCRWGISPCWDDENRRKKHNHESNQQIAEIPYYACSTDPAILEMRTI